MGIISVLATEVTLFAIVALSEIVSTIAILFAMWQATVIPEREDRSGSGNVWILAPLLLGAAAGVNFTYHFFIHLMGMYYIDDGLLTEIGNPWLSVFIICVQPAIFEELYFHGVVWNGMHQ
ncbi:hypothetical protein AB1L42_23770 [Thalassoglobus sp. JC818]|uniref:hypothetical protein n=1 Tax=Thalassoglobus sp. JC818 TaxID=3232136 RepID=UPI00345B00C6